MKRWMAGIGIAAASAAGVFVAPALQAQNGQLDRAGNGSAAILVDKFNAFTPASADPKLAAMIARSGLPKGGFGFTPSESRAAISRAATADTRGGSIRGNQPIDRTPAAVAGAPSVSVAPIAYNLAVSGGLKRTPGNTDITKVDLVGAPGLGDSVDLGIGYGGKRAKSRSGDDHPLTNAQALIGVDPTRSIDVGGSYSLTRNLDVTAGVRYNNERQRLTRITEQPRDSQAVYVGTAFRF